MTVLRSREISFSVRPKSSKHLTGKNAVFEPETSSKTSELMIPSSNISTPTGSGSPGQELGLESKVVVSETVPARRRSARLAGKLDNVEWASGKRIKLDMGNFENQAFHLDLGSGGGATELFTAKEEVEKDEHVDGSGLLGKVNGGSVSKRKLSIGAKLSSLEEEDELVKKVMSLRSGKRVVNVIDPQEDSSGSDRLEMTRKSKDSGFIGSVNHLLVPNLEKGVEEDENGYQKEKRFSKGQKGKGKMIDETLSYGMEIKHETEETKAEFGITTESSVKTKGRQTKEGEGTTKLGGTVTTRRLSKEEKGKTKMGVGVSSAIDINVAQPEIENIQGSSASVSINHSTVNEAFPDEEAQARDAFVFMNNAGDTSATNMNNRDIVLNAQNAHRERHRNFARRNASRFAHFSSQDELGPDRAPNAGNSNTPQKPEEDWPGPFSTAMKIVRDRAIHVLSATPTDKCETVDIKWIPKKQDPCENEKRGPSLQDLCLTILSKNADAITSLDFVPDSLRHQISWFLCAGRAMNSKFLELLVRGSPTEVRVRDCSWLSEELFAKIFAGLDASKLTVFEFDQCGSCMPDYNLHAMLACSPNGLPALTMISLKGAYRLTDVGISLLASAAPCLKSIDISQCPLLTTEGINCLLDSLRLVLRELYLDNCYGVDVMLIIPALLNLESLEVLSVAGIQTVCDDFISKFINVRGCRIKELGLADCLELTDFSLEIIGSTCSDLRAIDLSNLYKLTDASIAHLANGCQAIEILKLCRNGFSDVAIAAYLDIRGASLKILSLNNITQVSGHAGLSISRNCVNLRSLDLSWCRNLTNEAFGLIVDSCPLLEVLKVFGCTQITNVFVNGHSNRQVKLIGLKMTPLMKHIEMPDFVQGPLRYSAMSP